MANLYHSEGTLPEIPNVSLPQFILDTQTPLRPYRSPHTPWLIDDSTGKRIGLNELRARTFALANAMAARYKIREDDVVLLFSRNHVDYPVAIWAAHRLGAVISGANPDYSSGELLHQIEISNARIIICHADSLQIAVSAARSAGINEDNIILFNAIPSGASRSAYVTLEDLVQEGMNLSPQFVEPKIDAGTKIAFLSFSSGTRQTLVSLLTYKKTGTTGRPKAVAIPHIAPITNIIQFAVHNKLNTDYTPWEHQRYRPGDVALAILPFYHIYGLVLNLHFILFCGMVVVVVPKFNFTGMLDSIVRHRVTHLMLVPPQIVMLCKNPSVKNYNLTSVRMIMSGAAPLSDEINNRLFDLLPNAQIGQSYGMTETCTALSCWPTSQKRGISGSAGRLLPGVVAKIIKLDGALAGFDELGELVVLTPSAALRYHNNEQATKEIFMDGWVKTGDEVKIDRSGELWVVDRLKEIMKVRGFQVAPAELEGCILDHPDVADTCVVGVPDDYSGELPMAFIVLSASGTQKIKERVNAVQEIKESVTKHVADNKVKYKQLAGGVEIVDSIPKNPSGKLLRRILREKAKSLRGKIKTKL